MVVVKFCSGIRAEDQGANIEEFEVCLPGPDRLTLREENRQIEDDQAECDHTQRQVRIETARFCAGRSLLAHKRPSLPKASLPLSRKRCEPILATVRCTFALVYIGLR